MRNNDFTYAEDADGKQVPLGSHMRRMNPRDTKMAVLADVNLHRIIRRGALTERRYNPNAISEHDDEVPRRLHFIFMSAKAMATMEFLQQEWIDNGNFMDLGDERTQRRAAAGRGHVHDPQEPVRRRIHRIQTFNVLRGGEYSLHALSVRPAMAREPRVTRPDHRAYPKARNERAKNKSGPTRGT